MGIILKQTENRSELQKRIALDLSEKAKNKKPDPADMVDGVEDSAFVKGTKGTTSLAWLWILIVVAGVVALVGYVIASGNQA